MLASVEGYECEMRLCTQRVATEDIRIFWKARSEVADTRDALMAECRGLEGFCHAITRLNKHKSASRPCQNAGRVECPISQREVVGANLCFENFPLWSIVDRATILGSLVSNRLCPPCPTILS